MQSLPTILRDEHMLIDEIPICVIATFKIIHLDSALECAWSGSFDGEPETLATAGITIVSLAEPRADRNLRVNRNATGSENRFA